MKPQRAEDTRHVLKIRDMTRIRIMISTTQ